MSGRGGRKEKVMGRRTCDGAAEREDGRRRGKGTLDKSGEYRERGTMDQDGARWKDNGSIRLRMTEGKDDPKEKDKEKIKKWTRDEGNW